MQTPVRPGTTTPVQLVTVDEREQRIVADDVATEEPLEIRLVAGAATRTAAITMRTPGSDFELAAGFLYSEGVIRSRAAIRAITYCIDKDVEPEQRYNIVNVELAAGTLPNLEVLERHFTMTSACGVCGKATLEALHDGGVEPLTDGPVVPMETIYALPERMREAQRIFRSTGGLHASALFDESGKLVVLREDVGRHNALDKVVGWGLLNNHLPLARRILLVSGRSSYEIVQKSVVARIPIVCAVSAPSSLAVALAAEFNVTLVGFLRNRRANVYTAQKRLAPA